MALGGKNIDVSALDTMSPEDIAALDIETLADFQDEIDEAETVWDTRKKSLQFSLDQRFGEAATAKRLDAGKDTGTVHLPDGELSVACELRKKVEWDQEKLTVIRQRIAKGGGDPDIYMRTEYRIAETVYADFVRPVQDVFSEARTVKPERPKYIISDPKAPKKKSRR